MNPIPHGLQVRARISIFIILVLFYFAIPNARPDFTRFNCHDSESYLALSYGLVHGLGYTRSMSPDHYVPHTTWPPGVPIMMMPAIALSGNKISWLAVKCTMVFTGCLGIALVWMLARRFTHNSLGADLVALGVALNPLYWDFSHQAMAELPLTVWIIGSLLLIDMVWVQRTVKSWEAFLTGVVCGAGSLIKGHALFLIFAPLAYLIENRRLSLSRFSQLKVWVIFCLGFVLLFLGWSVRNSMLDTRGVGFDAINQVRMIRAKNVLDPESELLTLRESLQVVLKNSRSVIKVLPKQIVPGLWPVRLWDWVGSGYLALPISVLLVVLCIADRKGQNSIRLVILAITSLNMIYPFGGAARFWVPVSILMTILILIYLWQFLSRNSLFMQQVSVALIGLILSFNLTIYVINHESKPYQSKGSWAELAELFTEASQKELNTIGVLTPNPHAFRLITGYRNTYAEKDSEPIWDHIVVRIDGYGPKTPLESKQVLSVYPWAVYELPKPMRASELRATIKLDWKSYHRLPGLPARKADQGRF